MEEKTKKAPPMPKYLKLPIKPEWFIKIAKGEKTEEYREIKPWYTSRIDPDHPPDGIILTNGYGSTLPWLCVECKGVRIGTGKPEWGADPGVEYYVLELGEIISKGYYDIDDNGNFEKTEFPF